MFQAPRASRGVHRLESISLSTGITLNDNIVIAIDFRSLNGNNCRMSRVNGTEARVSRSPQILCIGHRGQLCTPDFVRLKGLVVFFNAANIFMLL